MGDLDRIKIKMIDTCRKLTEAGTLSQTEYLDICDLLDNIEEYDREEFRAELNRISKGLSDLIG